MNPPRLCALDSAVEADRQFFRDNPVCRCRLRAFIKGEAPLFEASLCLRFTVVQHAGFGTLLRGFHETHQEAVEELEAVLRAHEASKGGTP